MIRFLTAQQVQARYHISRASLYRWQADPRVRFPAPVKIGHRILWRDCDLVEFDHSLLDNVGGKDATN